MSDIRLYIVFWHLLVIYLHYGQCCGPAEIGQQYTIKSTARVYSDQRVIWEIPTNVLYDSLRYRDPNYYPDLYYGTRTQLTIFNVTRNDGTVNFRHNVNTNIKYECILPVYKRASTPTCETVTLTGNEINTTCTTAEVFPQAKCQFTLQDRGSNRREIADGTSYITYTHTDPEPGRNESCTLKYPVNGLKPGNWTVYVQMYPDQTGVSLAQGTIGQAANTLQLSVPIVEINTENCPKGLAGEGDTNVRNGYIRKGERASCECTRAHAGNPPGTIGWTSTQEGNLAILSQNEDKASIRLDSTDGPSSATVAFQSPGPIYLCPNQLTNINITCHVPVNSFNPASLFTIRHDNSNSLVNKATGDTAMSKSVNYNFTRSGQHSFTCQAENAVFGEIFSEAPVMAIQVYGPPMEPPRIFARSSQHGDVLMEGDDITVTCDVSGGYPSVQSVTLFCGQDKSVTINGTSAKLTLDKIPLTCSAINCTCQATHVTGCYNLKASTSIKVDVNHENKGIYTTAQLAGTAIGVFVGTLILEAVISLIVFVIRREKAMRKNRNKDREYNEIERPPPQPYQNVREPDPNYLKINSSGQASVPSSETAKQKTEGTYQNQAFGDETEATEPDLNAYNYIEDE